MYIYIFTPMSLSQSQMFPECLKRKEKPLKSLPSYSDSLIILLLSLVGMDTMGFWC